MRAKFMIACVGFALLSSSGAWAASSAASQEGAAQEASQEQQTQQAQPTQQNGNRPARPRVRQRNNFFGLPLLGIVIGGAGGAAALAGGGSNPNSP